MGIAERKEREKEQKQNAIIDAAEKVIFSKGLEAATMDEIAELAEFSKGTIYLYFKNKEDLYFAIHARGIRLLKNMFEKAAKSKKIGIDKVLAIGKAYYEYSKKYPDYYKAMVYYDCHPVKSESDSVFAEECNIAGEEVMKTIATTIQRGKEDKSIHPDVDPLKTAVILWGQSMGMIQLQSMKGHHDFGDHLNLDFEELIFKSFDMMIRSIRN
jgi:TetR/AcrR family transcriptional regulator